MSVKTSGSEIPITNGDLSKYFKDAGRPLSGLSYAPKKDLTALRSARAPKQRSEGLIFSNLSQGAGIQQMSILKVARTVNSGDELLEENINTSLSVVRFGLQIAMHVAALYSKTSGLEQLVERKSRNELKGDSEQAEWRSKLEAQAFIVLFVLSYYVSWKLSGLKQVELSKVNVAFDGLPEVPLSGQGQAIAGILYHYGSYLAEAQSGLEILKLTGTYFKAVFDDLKGRAPAFEKSAEAFADKSYKLEGTQFTIHGFQTEIMGGGPSVEFKRVDIQDIVGNHEGKHHAFRIAQYLVAYDFERKMNPLAEFGAFSWIQAYFGKPGTGKTMLIGATLTLVGDYCKALDIPFRPHPFPNAMVSTFQGGSGENMENWMRPLRNPNELIVAPIDDAEDKFESRTRQGVSSGVREVISVFLTNTEGVAAVVRGNAIILVATNLPDQIDAAVLSRIQGRTSIDGAVTVEDWKDTIRIWTGKMDGWNKGIVDLEWSSPYAFLSAQGLRRKKKAEELVEFKDKRLAEIHDRLRKRGLKAQGYDFFGELYVEVQRVFPQFTSRDERNIKTAVMTRFFDFDFPEEWLAKRDIFVGKPYEEKKNMIIGIAKENMGNLKFSDVLFEEAARYLDATVAIFDGGKERQVVELVERMSIEAEARKRRGHSA